jgi:hypothetical protein
VHVKFKSKRVFSNIINKIDNNKKDSKLAKNMFSPKYPIILLKNVQIVKKLPKKNVCNVKFLIVLHALTKYTWNDYIN